MLGVLVTRLPGSVPAAAPAVTPAVAVTPAALAPLVLAPFAAAPLVVAPFTRTPVVIVNRLREAAIKAVALPDVAEQLGRQGLEVETSTPAELAARIKTETHTWAEVIKLAGIKAE